MPTKTTSKEKRTAGSLRRGVMPRTPEQWAAYRCKISCKIGREALEGKADVPTGTSRLEYAVYNLLHAIEDLAEWRG